MFNSITRFLWGDDVFISYARLDGAAYAAGLANGLAERRLSCKFDQWGTVPGKEVPEPILQALRRSGMLVIVASEKSCQSKAVETEIREFLPTQRLIIPIDLCGEITSARWWHLIEGLPVSSDEETAGTGMIVIPEPATQTVAIRPSGEVLSRIESSIAFTKKDERLRKAAASALLVLALSLIAAVVAGKVATDSNTAADRAKRAAQTQSALADKAEDRRKVADMQARHASSVARAGDALTSHDPATSAALAKDALIIERDHPNIGTSAAARILTAQAINQGLPRVYRYFSRVGHVRLSPNGRYIAAIGSTAAALDKVELHIWSRDGGEHRTLDGLLLGAPAFSPDGHSLVVSRLILHNQKKIRKFHIAIEWYSYDLHLQRTITLQPVPKPSTEDGADNSTKDDFDDDDSVDARLSGIPRPDQTGFELLRGPRGEIRPASYVYDIQDLQFTSDGKWLAVAGLATSDPVLETPRHYRAWIDVSSFKFKAAVDLDNELSSFDKPREYLCLLNSSPYLVSPGLKELYLDDLITGQRQVIGTVSTEIVDIAGSSSGSRIAVVGSDNTVSIFDRSNASWSWRSVVLPGERGCTRVTFINDDYIAAARADFTITFAYVGGEKSRPKYLVDTSVGRIENPQFATLTGPASDINVLSVGPGGKWLIAGGKDRDIHAWCLKTHDYRNLEGNQREVTSIGFSNDADRFVTGSLDGTVRLWSLNEPFRRTVLASQGSADVDVYLSDSISDRGEILNLDMTRADVHKKLGFVKSIQISRDGKYVLVQTYDDTVSLWTNDLVLKRRFTYPTLAGAFISLDSRWIMIRRSKMWRGDGTVLVKEGLDLWQVDSEHKISLDGTISIGKGLFGPKGTWAEITKSRGLLQHRIEEGVDAHKIALGTFSPDGKWFAMPGSRDVELWRVNDVGSASIRVSLTGRPIFGEDDEPERDFAEGDIWTGFSGDSSRLGVSVRTQGESAIELVTLANMEHQILRGRGIHGPYRFSEDGRWLAGTGGGIDLIVWAVQSGEARTMGQHSELINSIDFSPDSKWIATGSADSTARVWAVDTSEYYEMRQSGAVKGVAFTADGRNLLQARGNGIQMWLSPSAPLDDMLAVIAGLTPKL